jgi:proteasome lid subunit RPN8/RPN11
VQITEEARAAFPRECCGLVEGRREEGRAVATALHPVKNFSPDADRFELDPAAHLRLLREARQASREIIGCYHSHPNGRAEPSKADAAGAGETDFLWLIAGVTEKTATLGIFVWTGRDFAPVARLAASPD